MDVSIVPLTGTMIRYSVILPVMTSPRKVASAPAPVSGDTGTVHRVLRVLSLFGERERWDLHDAATALDLPRTTTHRLLNLCRPLDFVVQDDDGRYGAGPALYRLAGRLAARMPVQRLARPLIEAIRDRIDETVLLALVARADLAMYFAMIASPAHPLRYSVELDRAQPLGWGAAARVILAHLHRDEIDAVIARGEPSPLDGRRLAPTDLRRSLAEIRRDGHAITYAQRSPDSWGVAAPFFDAAGQVAGSINITVPSFRIERHDRPALVALVRDATDRLTRGLGGEPTSAGDHG